MTDDPELLRRYAEENSEEAFAELVRRHLGLVYHAAVRQCGGDAHLAQDVAQRVFTDLARKAGTLARRPVLAGWLYTSTRYAAAQAARGERRRQARETEARAMSEADGTANAAADWERLRPAIDDALHALGERDREAVLLRFFEGRAFAEIGARVALTEDAARMRVERALEKMRTALARHGVTSTTAALGLALMEQAGAAVPVGLAATVTGAALAGAAAGGAITGAGILTFMSTTKIGAGIAGALALAGIGFGVFEMRRVREVEVALATVAREQSEMRGKLHETERRLQVEMVRKQAADDDAAWLLRTVEATQVDRAAKSVETGVRLTHDVVETRYKHALELAQNGDPAEALKEFLWCFDEGMPQVNGYGGVRTSSLLSEIARLGERYPPALASLRERRDKAEQEIIDRTEDSGFTLDLRGLNRALHEGQRTLEFYDRLPADHPLREEMAGAAGEQLLAARRYTDIALAHPWATMSSNFELTSNMTLDFTKAADPVAAKRSFRDSIVKSTSQDIEILAGTGDVEHARELAAKLLAYDGSEETRRIVQQHAERAGHPELLTVPPGR